MSYFVYIIIRSKDKYLTCSDYLVACDVHTTTFDGGFRLIGTDANHENYILLEVWLIFSIIMMGEKEKANQTALNLA